MTKDIVFNGKASELPAVLAHCEVTFVLKEDKFRDDKVKSAYFARLFRGSALDWLGTQIESGTDILNDWATFQKQVANHFGISEDTKERVAEQAIRKIRQTGSAQKYANDFDVIAERLGLADDTKPNFFRPGLKPEVARALVGKDISTYAKLRRAAIEVDEELFSIRQQTRRKKKVAGSSGSKGGQRAN
jgi:hypothetical protein